MKPLVSVIVPVYKVEDLLVRCLESLCRQSLSDIEILLIDDASPDGCGVICDNYATKDARFKVFHSKTNKGLSVARNIGIEHAASDYIMFVDSDDWVHNDFCKDTYECALRNQADLVVFRCIDIYNPECFKEEKYAQKGVNSGYKTRVETLDLFRKGMGVGHAAWNKIYRKELFHNVFYPPGYYCEDVGTTYKTVWQANRIFFLDEVLYYHCYREDSILGKKSAKLLSDYYEMFMQQYNDLASWGYPTDKLDTLLKNIALSYCIMKKPDDTDEHYIFCSNVLQTSKSIPVDLTWRRKIVFFLFKYCRPLFMLIRSYYDKKVC